MEPSDLAWYKRRSYLHFDLAIGRARALELVTDPNAVSRHSFYPLIHYKVLSKKASRNSNSGRFEYRQKERPISYAAHVDSQIYSYYAYVLGQLYEAQLVERGIGSCVLAFRSLNKCNIHFAKMVFDEISRRQNCTAIALDISKFFDSLDHRYLKARWANLLHQEKLPTDHYRVFRSISKWAVVDKIELYRVLGISIHNPRKGHRFRLCDATDFRRIVRGNGLIKNNPNLFGIPQGTPISAVLSNIYMLEFDTWLMEIMANSDGVYFRYCDDIIFITPSDKAICIYQQVLSKIRDLHLEINEAKTEFRVFRSTREGLISDKPLQYLGFTYDGQRILLRSAALARYSEKMKKAVRLGKRTMEKRNRSRVEHGLEPRPLFKKNLFRRYSHLGRRNFLRYGYRAADIMESRAIRSQLKPLWGRLQDKLIDEKD